VEWQRRDLDFPVLMLEASPWPRRRLGCGGGSLEGLYSVDVSYGDDTERVHLQTLARRGRRMDHGAPYWVGDGLPEQAGQAVSNLLFGTIEHGEDDGWRVHECLALGHRLERAFPGEPWQVRAVPVDGIEFAMWFATLPEGFAAALDYGPVVLTAWGQDSDLFDWRLTATPPDRAWPLIEGFDD
jgi:hypothetical protein